MKNSINVASISSYQYSEAAALQQLLRAVDVAMKAQLETIEQHPDYFDQFTITVGGQSIAFVLGGPQTAALDEFVQHIAEENGYCVDFANSTVSED